MMKSIYGFLVAALAVFATTAQAGYFCSVNAENPHKKGRYEVLLASYSGELPPDELVSIHENEKVQVTVRRTAGGAIQIFNTVKADQRITAGAIAYTGNLTMIDGLNRWLVVCVGN